MVFLCVRAHLCPRSLPAEATRFTREARECCTYANIHAQTKNIGRRKGRAGTWRSFVFLINYLLLYLSITVPFAVRIPSVAAASAPLGDITVCNNEVVTVRVTIALPSAPFGSAGCTTHRITACNLQQGLTVRMPPDSPPRSASRPLLRVLIEGSTLRQNEVAGNFSTLMIVSGVPSDYADPENDPSQYYSLELTILNTVISASTLRNASPGDTIALRLAGIQLVHSTITIRDSVIATEKRSSSGAAVGLWFADCYVSSGARVLLHNTTVSARNEDGISRGFYMYGSWLINGASVNITKSNITARVSGTTTPVSATAFDLEGSFIMGQLAHVAILDTVVDVSSAYGAGYGLRATNVAISGGAALDVRRCRFTVKTHGEAYFFERGTGAVSGVGTRLLFIDVSVVVNSAGSRASAFSFSASSTTGGASVLVVKSDIVVTSITTAYGWHFSGGSAVLNASFWLASSDVTIERVGPSSGGEAIGWKFSTSVDRFREGSSITVSSSDVQIRSTIGDAYGWHIPAGEAGGTVIAVSNGSSINIAFTGAAALSPRMGLFSIVAATPSASAEKVTFALLSDSKTVLHFGSATSATVFLLVVPSNTAIGKDSVLWYSTHLLTSRGSPVSTSSLGGYVSSIDVHAQSYNTARRAARGSTAHAAGQLHECASSSRQRHRRALTLCAAHAVKITCPNTFVIRLTTYRQRNSQRYGNLQPTDDKGDANAVCLAVAYRRAYRICRANNLGCVPPNNLWPTTRHWNSLR